MASQAPQAWLAIFCCIKTQDFSGIVKPATGPNSPQKQRLFLVILYYYFTICDRTQRKHWVSIVADTIFSKFIVCEKCLLLQSIQIYESLAALIILIAVCHLMEFMTSI